MIHLPQFCQSVRLDYGEPSLIKAEIPPKAASRLAPPAVSAYGNHQVAQAFADLFDKLEQRPSQITLFAKGQKKCVLLQNWLPTVENLGDSPCPKFEDMTNLEKTTLNKVTLFALWYE